MLSYRHAYHAGGPPDVLKHALLTFTLRHLQEKPAPLYLLDTHAGAGIYALDTPYAEKLAEWRSGILPVLRAQGPPELLAPLLGAVRSLNPGRQLERYPGSARLLADFARPQDRVELIELHPTDYATLTAAMAEHPNITVERTDGLAWMVAHLPPPERRGLVIIDPSYEVDGEAEAVVQALTRAHRRFGTGVFLLWYPVLDRAFVDGMMAALATTGIRRQYRVELALRPDGSGRGMTASGVILINPPWTLPAAVEIALPWLAAAVGATGPCHASWLVPPAPTATTGASAP